MHVDKMNQSRGRKLGQNQQGGNKDVALRSLVGSNIVAYGRITCTDKNAKGVDGLPLGDYCEVLVDAVLDNNVLLP
uniref:Transposase Tnp1/En/Spm-like domain-containing protein n=1 Tax=Arundo donax TaxID=35708 RepID=A0A0A9C3D6_ARUDO